MKFIVYSSSTSFNKYFSGLVDHKVEFRNELSESENNSGELLIVHISSFGNSTFDWLKNYAIEQNLKVVVCSNKPDIQEMLEAVSLGAKAYCNCYMQTQHYSQLFRLVDSGQSWFPAEMLSKIFKLAHQAMHGNDQDKLLEALTERETEVAKAVAKGLSNKKIADEFSISETTVKSHLTNIFKKLQLKDRVALVLYLK